MGKNRQKSNVKHQLMAHTSDYVTNPYRPIIFQYSETLDYYWFPFENMSLWHTYRSVFTIHDFPLQRITCSAMMKYDNIDDDGNEDVNGDDTAASGSGSDI